MSLSNLDRFVSVKGVGVNGGAASINFARYYRQPSALIKSLVSAPTNCYGTRVNTVEGVNDDGNRVNSLSGARVNTVEGVNDEGVNNQVNSLSGLILLGPPGVGKSFIVASVLRELGVSFVVVSSYTTPLALYEILYTNRDKVVVFDDACNILDNSKAKAMLLAGLWQNTSESRVIEYNSSSALLEERGLPTSFEFTGSIILGVNELPIKIQSIKSRCLFYYFNPCYEELIQLMLELCNVYNLGDQAFNFIKTHCTRFVSNLDFRIVSKMASLMKTNDDWEELLLTQLVVDEDAKLVWDLNLHYKNVNMMLKQFVSVTGLSRTTFYKYRKLLGIGRKQVVFH